MSATWLHFPLTTTLSRWSRRVQTQSQSGPTSPYALWDTSSQPRGLPVHGTPDEQRPFALVDAPQWWASLVASQVYAYRPVTMATLSQPPRPPDAPGSQASVRTGGRGHREERVAAPTLLSQLFHACQRGRAPVPTLLRSGDPAVGPGAVVSRGIEADGLRQLADREPPAQGG